MPSLQEAAPPLPPPPEAPVSEEVQPARTASFASAPSQPASSLVRRALQPECSVDFPQITEICERLEIQPGEIRTTVAVLAKALRDRRQPLQVKLKALTIAHEMLYNQQVVEVFAEAEGLREALEALRQVRGNELGAAMDENVRMLATEIVGRCFEGKSSSNGWSSFAKAMSSDLDKARKAARKNFQHFSQKAEKHMEKAERVFERGATMLMQEAENMLSGPSSSNPKPALRGPEKQPLTTEDEQLQWALAQSLKEANRQNAGGYSEASNPQPPSAEDLSPEVLQADSRATAVEEALGAQLAAEDADAKATAQLAVKLQDAMNKAQHLATLLSKAEHELTGLKRHREMLEEKVLCAASEQSHLQQLRKRLLELEAQAASISTADTPPTDELQAAAEGKMPAEIPCAIDQEEPSITTTAVESSPQNEEHSIATTAVAANPQNEEPSTSTTAVESNPQNEEHSIAATAVAANPQNEETSTSTTAVESNPQNEEHSIAATAVAANPQNEEPSTSTTAVESNPQNEEHSIAATAVAANPQNEVMDQSCMSRSDDAEALAGVSSGSPEALSRECEEATGREKELFSADVGAEGQSALSDGLLKDHELQVSAPKEVHSESHEPAEAESAESEEMKQTGAAEVRCDLHAKPDAADETSVAQLTIPATAAADTTGMPAPEATDAIDGHAGGVGEQLGASAADAPGS